MTITGFETSTIVLGSLLAISELLPFIRKHKGNGFIDTIICLLRGSSCVKKKIADTIEEKQDEETIEIKV